MLQLSAINHENLSNVVYGTLCDALISGKFKPGDRLKIRDLAEQLGTSVTPVRDAILRLTHDDAIIFQSARNIQIPMLTEARYLEIRTIRLRLEALAAETAAQVAKRKSVADLERILSDNEKALRDKDGLRGTELNQTFHFELAKIAGLPLLHGILRRLWLQMGPIIADVYVDAKRDMIDYHYKVLEALKAHDGRLASQAIMDDITLGGRAILERVRNDTP